MLAHVGHWWTELLYVLPVALVAGGLALAGRREKRRPESAPPVRSDPTG